MRVLARRSVLYVLLPALTLVMLGASHLHQRAKRCEAVLVEIDSPAGQGFLDETRVRNLIGADNQLIDAPIGDIDLESIETTLRETNYVDRVDAYVTSNGQVAVKLTVRQPIARILPAQGHSYYVDANEEIIPLSHRFTARAVLVTGHPVQRFEYGLLRAERIHPGVFQLVKRLNANPALRAQVAEVYVDERGEVTLLPELGQTQVVLGNPSEGLEGKLAKLEQFYQNVAPRMGWNHYAQVDLSFDGQIVAQRQRTPIRPRPVVQPTEAPRPTGAAAEPRPLAAAPPAATRPARDAAAPRTRPAAAQPNEAEPATPVAARRAPATRRTQASTAEEDAPTTREAADATPQPHQLASASRADDDAERPSRPVRRFRVGRAAASDRDAN